VCRRWLSLVSRVYAESVSLLQLTFEEHHCAPDVVVESVDARSLVVKLSMCQCPSHVRAQLATLAAIMAHCAPRLEQLVLEDYFLLRSSFVAEETFDKVLGVCADRGARLQWLEMHSVDMSKAGALVCGAQWTVTVDVEQVPHADWSDEAVGTVESGAVRRACE